MSRLDRFRVAQNQAHTGFLSALAEIQAGAKRGHWIWYVFPQLDGLGASSASRTFAIDGPAEAAEYLRDPELRSRLSIILKAVVLRLKSGNHTTLRALMGSDIDVRKLVSSLTLFGCVARQLQLGQIKEADIQSGESRVGDAYSSVVRLAEEILAAADAEGYAACTYTLERRGRGKQPLGREKGRG